MLNGFLGRKFSAKCKQPIKCIKTRIVLIRKKKQAMLYFLKKDVADLLSSGHDTNALGRMDQLMVEMNKISCYDAIEHYCDSILCQLSCLEKQRECPQEEMVAVATLIFAAARFSDLPELGHLRHTFISRYGSALESSVDAQFKEKIVARTFSKDKKLKMMEDISHQFSVRWDVKLFDQKRIYPSATEAPRRTDLPIANSKQGNLHAMVKEQKGFGIDTQQEMDSAIRKQHISRAGNEPAPKFDALREIKRPQVKDVHMVSNLNNDFQADCTNKSGSTICDEHQNIKLSSNHTTTVPYTKSGSTLDGHNIESQQDAVTTSNRSQQEKVDNPGQERKFRELEPTHDRLNIALHSKTKGYKDRMYSSEYNKRVIKSHDDREDSDTASQSARELSHDRSQNIGPPINKKGLENKNLICPDANLQRQYDGNHAVDYHHNDRSALGVSNAQEGSYTSVTEKQASGLNRNANHRFKNMTPPYVRPTDSKNRFHAKEYNDVVAGHKARIQHDVEPPCEDWHAFLDDKPLGSHAANYHTDSSMVGMSNTQNLYASVTEEQVAGMECANNDRHQNMIPPYVKTTGSNPRFYDEEHHDGVAAHKVRIRQDIDPHSQEQESFQNVKSVVASPLKNMVPPYVKSDASKNGDQVEHSTNAISAVKDSNASFCIRSDDNEHTNLVKANWDGVNKPEPRSVRRKHSKLHTVDENNNNSIDDRDQVHNRIPSDGKDGERRRTTIVDDYDEEEMFVDKLLMHYSRKGMTHQTSKSRSRSRTRTTDNVAEYGEVRKHHKGQAGIPEAVQHDALEKAISLPSKQMGRADARKPERAFSMEPDTLSPSGAWVHPHLPDYDELTARFTALKRS